MTDVERFEPRELGPKDWGTETLVAQTPHYIGKILRMRAGTRGPYQYHVHKDETFCLFSGLARVTSEYRTFLMTPGESVHVSPGTKHMVEAIEDCVFFEASTPHFDDRVACA